MLDLSIGSLKVKLDISTLEPFLSYIVKRVNFLFFATSPQQRGPLRQDVPPSPTPPLRGLQYDTMTRGGGGRAYR